MINHIFSIKNQSVKLSDIDLSDETYRITTAGTIDNLKTSIQNMGLLNPPIIIENTSGFMIICGFRRIEACCALQWDYIPAKILDPETSRLACAQIAITDNALQRPLNLIEKSQAINLLARFLKDDNDMAIQLSALGLPENPSIIQKIKKLCHLFDSIQKSLLSNTITLPVALMLGELEATTATGFVELFEYLKPSLNKQREILTLVKEVANREDILMHQILKESPIQEILHDTRLDGNQKTRMIRQYLKKRRFPALTKAEALFDQRIKELKLGKNIRLTPPPNFEGSTYTLTLYFKNLNELKNSKAIIDTIIQNPALENILEATRLSI